MTITAPTSRDQVINQLAQEGNDLKITINTAEDNVETWFPGKRFAFGVAHSSRLYPRASLWRA